MFNKKLKDTLEIATKFADAKKDKLLVECMRDYKHQCDIAKQHIQNLLAIQKDKWTPLPRVCKAVCNTSYTIINYDIKPNMLLLHLKIDPTMRTDGKYYYIIKLGEDTSDKIFIKGDVTQEIDTTKSTFTKDLTIIMKEKGVFSDHEKGEKVIKLDKLIKQCTYQTELVYGTKHVYHTMLTLKVRQSIDPEVASITKDILSVDTYFPSFKGGFAPSEIPTAQTSVSCVVKKPEPAKAKAKAKAKPKAVVKQAQTKSTPSTGPVSLPAGITKEDVLHPDHIGNLIW